MPIDGQKRGRGRRRREQARADLLKAAVELSENAPYRDLTVEEIARAAGISRSAFYLHFRDKDDLLLAAVEEIDTELTAAAKKWWRAEASPAKLVRDAITGVVSIYGEHAGLMRVATEVSAYDDEVREAWVGIMRRFIEATVAQIKAERRRGLVPERLDPEATAEALVWMAERCCYVYLCSGERSPDEVTEQLATVWTAALYPGVTPADELDPDADSWPIFGVRPPGFRRESREADPDTG